MLIKSCIDSLTTVLKYCTTNKNKEFFKLFNEQETTDLIKFYAYRTYEEELQEELKEDNVEYFYDVSARGLAHYFSGITEDKIEGYFKRQFNRYVNNNIYITEQGFYAVFHV